MPMLRNVILFLCFGAVLFTSNTCTSGLTFYVLESRYDNETQEFFQSRKSIQPYIYLGEFLIDPRKTGRFNDQVVTEVVSRHIPDPMYSGVVSLNIESDIYKDLRDYQSSDA